MTSRQRRAHHSAIRHVAGAPRKSYLGRFTPLTGIQSGWIKSLLIAWGEYVGGKTPAEYRLENCNRFIVSAKSDEWSDAQLQRITEALAKAKKEGFTGRRAVARAHTILWAKSLSEMIDETNRREDADLVECAVLAAFKSDDPVLLIGLQYYTSRAKIADIARELQSVAPWLAEHEARRRCRWCVQIFEAKVFLAVRRESAVD
ncbi:hypothetical protein JT31_01945 [Cedecea neteri]|uniref:Uncharacterized protein n=1 Tax=Cedecea neteri TaxID=158822 RepID=A0A089PZ10_9ENTR|nr:hypothetical protein [Cedecea neteri]AIR03424.1 hypothetical protein JT31_01945 [Cedecea neteri]